MYIYHALINSLSAHITQQWRSLVPYSVTQSLAYVCFCIDRELSYLQHLQHHVLRYDDMLMILSNKFQTTVAEYHHLFQAECHVHN